MSGSAKVMLETTSIDPSGSQVLDAYMLLVHQFENARKRTGNCCSSTLPLLAFLIISEHRVM